MEYKSREDNHKETMSELQSTPDAPPKDKPVAVKMVIQSWTTPIVGIVMLVIGLFAGYFGRSLIAPDEPQVVAKGEQSSDSSAAPLTIPTPDVERAAQQQELMSEVLDGTRHFLGDPNAPVTIIEFSDFQ